MNVPRPAGFSPRDFEHRRPTANARPPQSGQTEFSERPIKLIDRDAQWCIVGTAGQGGEPDTLTLALLEDEGSDLGRSRVGTGDAEAVTAVASPDSVALEGGRVFDHAVSTARIEPLKTAGGASGGPQSDAAPFPVPKPAAMTKTYLNVIWRGQAVRLTFGTPVKIFLPGFDALKPPPRFFPLLDVCLLRNK